MPEPMTKEQLHEAFALARSMGNAFKSFRQAENVIGLAIQAMNEQDRLEKNVEAMKKISESARQETSDLNAQRDQAKADLDQEVVRLAAYRKEELAKIDAEISTAREEADKKIEEIQAAIAAMDVSLEKARSTHAEALASLEMEIADKTATLEKVREQLKKSLGGEG